ncbi:hypothetical protein J4481_01645 [Candidatus Pacearchaeota archaeon]|nr:hypothetical protein [Candidatus Pacearchaeota archaeon]
MKKEEKENEEAQEETEDVSELEEELTEIVEDIEEKLADFTPSFVRTTSGVLNKIAEVPQITNLEKGLASVQIQKPDDEEFKLDYSSGYKQEEEKNYSEVPKWEMEKQTIKTKRMDESQLGREQVTQTVGLINSESARTKSSGNLEQNYISTEKIDESQLGRGKNSLGKDYRIQ